MELFKISVVSASLFFGCSWIITGTFALDLESSNENSCFPVKSIQLDLEWAFKHKFYMPMVSRSKLYHLIVQMFEPVKPSEINEASIYYDSCLRMQFFRNSSVIVSGYGGTQETEYLTGPVPEINGGFYRPITGNGRNSGTWWTIKTDNKTYAVLASCSNNQISWVVVSTNPSLPPTTVKHIKEDLIEIGFKEAYFAGLRYDICHK